MPVPAFITDVAAGTISGAIVAYVPLLWRRSMTTSAPERLVVAGNRNLTLIDRSNVQRWECRDYSTTTTVNLRQQASRSTASRTEDELSIAVVAGALAVVAFMFAWPLALGFLLGSSVVTAASYCRLAWDPALRPAALQSRATLHGALAVGIAFGNSALAFFASVNGHGLLSLERDLQTRFPGYSNSISTRWDVLAHHTSAVFSMLGWQGNLTLLSQVAGLVLSALVTELLAIRAIGAFTLRQQVAGRRVSPRRRRLAKRLLTGRLSADLGVTVFVGAISLVLSSGLALHLLMASTSAPSEGLGAKLSDSPASIAAKEENR